MNEKDWEGFNEVDLQTKTFREIWKEMEKIEPLTHTPYSPEDYDKIPHRY
tara:strand:+ start:217 stop:366 length:150 start_codon:yes stop_codon:yes gene_type:complete